jgi:hypothetical protein
MDFWDPVFLIPYTLSVMVWVAGGFFLCTARHKKRGIEVDPTQVIDLDPSPLAKV